MGHLFGTDGVRGIANTELTCQTAFQLGQAAVTFLGRNIVIGKDTRKSGDMLEAAMVAGVTSMGGSALLAGIIPTPGVALLVRELYADGGIIISASHNPPAYNGIKFFDDEGYKLSIEREESIEEFITSGGVKTESLPTGDDIGVSFPIENACEIYINHAIKSVAMEGIRFDGLKIALDVGYGAASLTTAEALIQLGAEVTVINDDFDGSNINVECGSTHLAPVIELVKEIGADVGIAHDGDADRVLMVGASGIELDGDVIEAVCALDLLERGMLPGNKVVSTVMCNLGFVHAMRDAGIEVVQTQVGDRYVLEAMREQGLVLGGEQSGHIIFNDYNSTGDGLVSALQFLAACQRRGQTVEEAASIMQHYPQVLINVNAGSKAALNAVLKDNEVIASAVKKAQDELGESGRILVRPSGTEPVVRVMVEATDHATAESVAHELASLIEGEL